MPGGIGGNSSLQTRPTQLKKHIRCILGVGSLFFVQRGGWWITFNVINVEVAPRPSHEHHASQKGFKVGERVSKR